jgi:hypothetical protein
MNWRDAILVRSSSWVRQSLRRWCSASSASHSRKIVALVSLRTWWVRDSIRGRGTGAASCSAPDRSRRPNTTSISSGADGGLELDAPPVSPPVSGGGGGSSSWRLLHRCDATRCWCRCRRILGWGMGNCWRCLGSSRRADRRHHSQQMLIAESQTCRWAWYPVEEVWPWEHRGKKP